MNAADVVVADAVDRDVVGIVEVAATVDELVGGCGDPAYLSHLRRHGRVVVAHLAGRVVGYAASHRIGTTEMVTDLFVHPDHHGHGVGKLLLDAVWTSSHGPRMTFSSKHAHALPLYLRAGMAPRWPLLWLRGDPTALAATSWSVTSASVDEVTRWEQVWLGVDRAVDYGYWLDAANGRLVVVRDAAAEVAGVGALGGRGDQYGVAHFTARDASVSDAALTAAIRTLPRQAFVALPGPHPTVRTLVGAQWRITDADYWMATDDALVEARCQALSPGLG